MDRGANLTNSVSRRVTKEMEYTKSNLPNGFSLISLSRMAGEEEKRSNRSFERRGGEGAFFVERGEGALSVILPMEEERDFFLFRISTYSL